MNDSYRLGNSRGVIRLFRRGVGTSGLSNRIVLSNDFYLKGYGHRKMALAINSNMGRRVVANMEPRSFGRF